MSLCHRVVVVVGFEVFKIPHPVQFLSFSWPVDQEVALSC